MFLGRRSMGNFLRNKRRLFLIDERNLCVILFTLFGTWLISFPYEGEILYALISRFQLNSHIMGLGAIIFHIAGLFLCGFYVKTMKSARLIMISSTVVCIIGSGIFFFDPSVFWYIALFTISYFAGNWMAAWGYSLKLCVQKDQRRQAAGSVLIYSALLMILINMLTVHLSVYLGLSLSILILLIELLFSFQLPEYKSEAFNFTQDSNKKTGNIAKPLSFLCLFIVVLTINSGLMFQFIGPAFAHLERLTSWYWAVPYIAAIFVAKRLPQTFNRAYILYIAIALIGFSFIAFMGLDRSAASYLIINTMMLGAFGIFDLFWWSILGEMLDLHDNPAKILGIGLTANVSGVLLGELIVKISFNNAATDRIPLIALSVVCVTLMILPPLHKYILNYLDDPDSRSVLKKDDVLLKNRFQNSELTERECQIVELLLQGRTYRMIAEELYLSENTVKTHIKNIYSKLAVKNKSELIQKVTQ